MKKIFLLLSFLVMTVSAALADTTEFDFVSNDYGLDRATMTARLNMDGSCFNPITDWRKTLDLHQGGVDLVFSDKLETGKGFGLETNTTDSNLSGLVAFAAFMKPGKDLSTNPVIDITVPGGKITSVKFYLNGSGLSADMTECLLNGVATPVKKDGAVYLWTFSNKEGVEKVTFEFESTPMYPRIFRQIEVTYQRDLGGKQECGLSFGTDEAKGIMGQAFTAPVLANPNNLPVNWSSSNEAVATVDAEGNVTMVGGGVATITAATPGNDSYADGSAAYKLTVVPTASNLKEMAEMAPIVGNEVYVNFPITVTYPSGNNALLIDAEDNVSEFHNTKNDDQTGSSATIYKVGDVIPAGWVATNNIGRFHSHIVWNGLPKESTETVEVVYPIVEKVNYEADCDRVVILKNVVFDKKTESGDDKFFGVCNGESYQFQNSYSQPAQPAGTYDVTVVVKYNKIQSTVYAYLAPVAFVVPSTEDPIVVPATSELKVEISGEGTIAYDEDMEALIGTTTTEEENASVTLTIPEGFDNFVWMDVTDMMGAGEEDEEDPWVPVASLTENGFTLGNVISVPADGKPHMFGLYIVKDEKAYQEAGYNMVVTATKKAVAPVSKSFTFDFTTENYGIKAGSISAKALIVNYEDVILTNGTTSSYFTAGSGIRLNKWATMTVSSESGPVKEVTVESVSPDPDFEVKIEDGVATITNWYEGTSFVSKINVVYEDDGLQKAEIKYPAAALQLVNGVQEIKGLVLENPNNVPVTYTSSDANIIVNDKGEISLAEGVKAATATITATFEGNSTYRAAEASYALTIIEAANSLAELKAMTPKGGEKVYVNFPVVVAYSNGSFAFIQNLEGTESAQIYLLAVASTYPANSIIPAGWTATASKSNGLIRYSMSDKPKPVQTQEPKIETVTEITTADVNKVLILKNLDITEEILEKLPTGTATGGYAGVDVTSGDATYNFYNQFKVDKPAAAGMYDVKCAVLLYSNKIRLYPIEYTAATVTPEPVSGTVTYNFLTNDYGQERGGSAYVTSGTIFTEGISSITLTKGATSSGFRMWTDGLRVYKNAGNTLDIKVEGAQINKIVINAPKTLNTPTFNGEEVSYSNKQYVWTGDSEAVSVVFATTSNNPIETITIDYTILAPGKEAADLSFSAAEFTVGETEAFTKGVLSNPNELPVTWTSSDEAVATVTEDGAIVIKGIGTTVITAKSEETDKFAAGEASYKLTVVAAATTVPAMIEKAPKVGDEILMNGTLYVAYANGQYVYVYDLFDNATLLYGANSFVTGDVIPGGWVAKNAEYNGLLEWSGSFPASTQNIVDFIEYPVVETLTKADVNRVVTIPNVEFTEDTPAKNQTVAITLPDGSKVDLYNKFDIAQQTAGKYDVVAAVTIYKDALQVYPIEYNEVKKQLTYPEQLDITCSFDKAQVTQKIAGDGTLQVNIVADKTPDDTFTATIAVPEGWTGLLVDASEYDDVVVSMGGVSPMKRANAAYWVGLGQLEAMGYVQGNAITVPVIKAYNAEKLTYDTYSMQVLLINADQADYANGIELNIKVNKDDLTGVEAIDAINNGARFFTLDGVEVVNPTKGVYVKVADGKATKVVVR
ncbi:MAG: Ig-like domain-containing protein [Muribaculaceae bacterium]|nr:Ig-like domain-containing protein [Muribaculaceae bacterium]